MKKNYLFLAAATTLFAACVQTDVVTDIPEPQQQAISFETFANKQTRAENSGAGYKANDLSNHHTTFKVWASKLVAENDPSTNATSKYVPVYADNAPGTVTYTSSWTASPLKYWDKTATSYEFYAAAPAVPSQFDANDAIIYGWVATNTNSASGYLKFINYVLKGTSSDNLASITPTNDAWTELDDVNDIDLMIAAPCNVPNANYKTTPSAVNLNFIHILSRLNIAVKATTTANGATYSPEIVLTELNVCGLKNKGTFTESTVNTLASGTHVRWSNTESVDIDVNSTPYVLQAHIDGNGLTLTQTAQYTHKYLIIPQLVENKSASANVASAPNNGEVYLQIKYTVDSEEYETYYSLAQAFGIAFDNQDNDTENLAFNEGWQNTLTITISPDEITFTGDVAAWDNKNNNTSDDTNDPDSDPDDDVVID
ncbi:MAG: fimbrillin family protein [Bacteroidaceae bacterium]|nr:fimbrillin family protein [Bacteroidaceae bacterium]